MAKGTKHPAQDNHLCISCRRQCKQPAAVCVSLCPRYYPKPKIKAPALKQLELTFPDTKKSE